MNTNAPLYEPQSVNDIPSLRDRLLSLRPPVTISAEEIGRLRVMENELKECYALAKSGEQDRLETALVKLFMTVAPPEERVVLYAEHIRDASHSEPRAPIRAEQTSFRRPAPWAKAYKSGERANTRGNF